MSQAQRPEAIGAVEARLLEISNMLLGAVIAVVDGAEPGIAGDLARFMPRCTVEQFTVSEAALFAETCRARAIRHLLFLRLDGDQALAALAGAEPLLRYARIDFISLRQVEARRLLPAIAAAVLPHGYDLYAVQADGGGFVKLASWLDGVGYRDFVAAHSRFAPFFEGERAGFDLGRACLAQNVEIRGILHVGANRGQELDSYRGLGAKRVALVEADPAVYADLADATRGQGDVIAIQAAIVDRDGPITFHVNQNDLCSSVLPVAELERLNPTLSEREMVEVPGLTIDSLFERMREADFAVEELNILVLDIQGAELMALSGATATLDRFDAIAIEVSFEELYQGCPQIEEIEDFLNDRDFVRAAMTVSWHPTWSDAFYVRRGR